MHRRCVWVRGLPGLGRVSCRLRCTAYTDWWAAARRLVGSTLGSAREGCLYVPATAREDIETAHRGLAAATSQARDGDYRRPGGVPRLAQPPLTYPAGRTGGQYGHVLAKMPEFVRVKTQCSRPEVQIADVGRSEAWRPFLCWRR